MVDSIEMASPSGGPDPRSLVKELRGAFATGRTLDLEWRVDQLSRLEAMLRAEGESLVQALAGDLGRPEFESWGADLGAVLAELGVARRQLAHGDSHRGVVAGSVPAPAR